jgi:hypothetical protein
MTKSIGCIDFGNNNFYEVMKDGNGVITFQSHDEDPTTPGITLSGLFREIESDPTWVNEVIDQLSELLK